jgi:hypothetical protein
MFDGLKLKNVKTIWPFKDYYFIVNRYVIIEDSVSEYCVIMWYYREDIDKDKTPTEY